MRTLSSQHMPPVKISRGRPRTDIKDRILDTAARMFYQKSINSISSDKIIRAAGVSKMGFYYHFSSKDALVKAYLEYMYAGYISQLRSAMASRIGHRINTFASALAVWLKSSDFYGCPFMRAISEGVSDEVRQQCTEHKSRLSEELYSYLSAEATPSDIRRIMVIIDGMIARYHMIGDLRDITEGCAMLNFLARGGRRTL